MTATRTDPSPATPRLTFGGLVRSEAIKARGLRSTTRLLVASAVVPVVGALMTAQFGGDRPDGYASAVAVALAAVTGAALLSVLLVVLLGTIVATAEYERGAVMTTFAVAPRRTAVVLAKVAVVAVAVLVSQLVACLLGYLGAALVLGEGAATGIGEPGVLRALLGTALYGAAAATIAMCVGLLVRSSIGAVAATLGFLYVVPALLQAIPSAAVITIARSIPGPASTPLEAAGPVAGSLSFGAALLAVLAWTVATVVLAVVVVRRRDV
jgi:ABC-2 type transport system permease protein